jgi:hypothetical protein
VSESLLFGALRSGLRHRSGGPAGSYPSGSLSGGSPLDLRRKPIAKRPPRLPLTPGALLHAAMRSALGVGKAGDGREGAAGSLRWLGGHGGDSLLPRDSAGAGAVVSGALAGGGSGLSDRLGGVEDDRELGRVRRRHSIAESAVAWGSVVLQQGLSVDPDWLSWQAAGLLDRLVAGDGGRQRPAVGGALIDLDAGGERAAAADDGAATTTVCEGDSDGGATCSGLGTRGASPASLTPSHSFLLGSSPPDHSLHTQGALFATTGEGATRGEGASPHREIIMPAAAPAAADDASKTVAGAAAIAARVGGQTAQVPGQQSAGAGFRQQGIVASSAPALSQPPKAPAVQRHQRQGGRGGVERQQQREKGEPLRSRQHKRPSGVVTGAAAAKSEGPAPQPDFMPMVPWYR